MEHCSGRLLMHCDGSPAACTEELDGRMCPGVEALHAGSPVTCEAILGPGGCETCGLEQWSERQWRHAVHVGLMSQTTTFCTMHRRVRWLRQARRAICVGRGRITLRAGGGIARS